MIDKKKHDLRLYLMICSIDPLIAFINEEGLARFCTQNYEKPTKENLDNMKIHLTNYSQNKSNKNFKISDVIIEDNKASKRTLTSYWKAVQRHGYDSEQVTIFILFSKLTNLFFR